MFLSGMEKKKNHLRPTEKKWSAVLLVGVSSAGPRQTHFIMDLTPFGPCEGERKMRLTPRERDERVERERGWKKRESTAVSGTTVDMTKRFSTQ